MATLGLFYFGRHFVCDRGRIVASITAWLPHGIDRFTDDEVTILSSNATAMGRCSDCTHWRPWVRVTKRCCCRTSNDVGERRF